MKKVAIIGSGMMGSALAFPLCENGHEVALIGTPLDREIIENCQKAFFIILEQFVYLCHIIEFNYIIVFIIAHLFSTRYYLFIYPLKDIGDLPAQLSVCPKRRSPHDSKFQKIQSGQLRLFPEPALMNETISVTLYCIRYRIDFKNHLRPFYIYRSYIEHDARKPEECR
jgi:hypothetical protein